MNDRRLLETPVQNQIGGNRTMSTDGPTYTVSNPATGERLAEFNGSTRSDVDDAVDRSGSQT